MAEVERTGPGAAGATPHPRSPAAPSALRSAVELAALAAGVGRCWVLVRHAPDGPLVVIGDAPPPGDDGWTGVLERIDDTDEPVAVRPARGRRRSRCRAMRP